MLRAILFDLDGTLADTEPLHFEAFAEVFRGAGLELTRADYFQRLIGFNDYDCFAAVMRENGRVATAAELGRMIDQKARIYQAMIADRDVLYPGAAAFVGQCAERFPLILVTGTLRAEAEMITRRAGLRDRFIDIVAAEDVERGKPAPDGFLLGLGRLGFRLRPRPSLVAAECLAVEDTSAGIEAAHRAGMRVLALCHTASADELRDADLVRPVIGTLDLDEVLRSVAAFG